MAKQKYVCDNCESELTPKERRSHRCMVARVLIKENQCPGCSDLFQSAEEMMAHNCPAAGLDKLDNDTLLQLYLGSLALGKLHSERGGLDLSRSYYIERATNIRLEILSRMRK